MAVKHNIRIDYWIVRDHSWGPFAEIQPHFLSVFVLVQLFELVVVEPDLCLVHRRWNYTDSGWLLGTNWIFNIWLPFDSSAALRFVVILVVTSKYRGLDVLLVVFTFNFVEIVNYSDVWLLVITYVRELLLQFHTKISFSISLCYLLFSLLLLFYSLSILHKLIVQLIINQAVHCCCSNDVITLRHFVPHTPSWHQLNNDRLWSLVPISFQLFVSDAIKQNIVVPYCPCASALNYF